MPYSSLQAHTQNINAEIKQWTKCQGLEIMSPADDCSEILDTSIPIAIHTHIYIYNWKKYKSKITKLDLEEIQIQMIK